MFTESILHDGRPCLDFDDAFESPSGIWPTQTDGCLQLGHHAGEGALTLDRDTARAVAEVLLRFADTGEILPTKTPTKRYATVTEVVFDPPYKWGAQLPEDFDIPDNLTDEKEVLEHICDAVSANWQQNCVDATFTVHAR